MLRHRLFLLVLLGLVLSLACAPAVRSRPTPPARDAAVAVPAEPVEIEAPPQPEPSELVPVTPNDPSWGDPLAPVTWVIWGDYECPYTAKLVLRLEAFMDHYGPKKLRIVWRHNPLPFHKSARPLAVAAETAFRLGGPRAFWYLTFRLFENQKTLGPTDVVRWAGEAGVDGKAFVSASSAGTFENDIDDDMAVGKKAGVTGTPTSFVNGTFLSGAQPAESFLAVIDRELAEADERLAAGVPRERLYAAAVEKNFPNNPARKLHEEAPQDTTTVWKVPLGTSPARGKPTASVTIVMFTDFQCPFCGKVVPTLESLERAYGDKLRIVFKHNPLPFHPRAEPAAELAIEARARGGDAKFWEAHRLLFASQHDLSDTSLESIARTLGIDAAIATKAIAQHKHKAVIEADQMLAEDLSAAGTPHFFINGRRLVGSQPEAKFKEIIDEEITKADKLLAAGTPASKLYDTLQKDGRSAPDPERIVVPAATAANPAKGAKPWGKVVVVQMFADFQCPFCGRAQATIDALMAEYPGKVRVVWRHLPLSMHKDAQRAAEASVEAFKQKGDTGFWAFAKLLWDDQSALDEASLLAKATAAGLDAKKMKAALDAGTHAAAVKADTDLAARLHISATPTFAVGDYYVAGAQPLTMFKRYVALSLGPHAAPTPDSIHGAKKAPVPPADGKWGAKHLVVMYLGSTRAPATVTRTKAEALARAQEARRKALAGAKFDDLVTQYSDEPSAAARGGDLGIFPAGRMVEEFQKGVEATAVGAISEVVETPFGYHVILRTR